jgi:hypothetical protein
MGPEAGNFWHNMETKRASKLKAPIIGSLASGPQQLISPAALKKARYICNLQRNMTQFKATLDSLHHFAKICELSDSMLQEIDGVNQKALSELSKCFTEKLAKYDARLGG